MKLKLINFAGTERENWNGLINFLKNKAVLASPANDKIVSGRSGPPSGTNLFIRLHNVCLT